jgi:hypothetical protein
LTGAAVTDALLVPDADGLVTDRRGRAIAAAATLLPGVSPIRPAPPALAASLRPAIVAPTSSPAPAIPPPIHVRIGRIEVRGAPAPAPPVAPGPPATGGFAAYTRLRNYRLWPR